MKDLKRNVAIMGSAAVLAGLGVGGVLSANADTSQSPSDDQDVSEHADGDGQVPPAQQDAATAAALKATNGGTANEVERDSENGATWEVEVTRTDGTTVDVRLDENYKVVVIEGDGESE
jgi:uncharacterized membrane protein YkoI